MFFTYSSTTKPVKTNLPGSTSNLNLLIFAGTPPIYVSLLGLPRKKTILTLFVFSITNLPVSLVSNVGSGMPLLQLDTMVSAAPRTSTARMGTGLILAWIIRIHSVSWSCANILPGAAGRTIRERHRKTHRFHGCMMALRPMAPFWGSTHKKTMILEKESTKKRIPNGHNSITEGEACPCWRNRGVFQRRMC